MKNTPLHLLLMISFVMMLSTCSKKVVPFDKRESINARSFGVKGDGRTNDTKAIQNLIINAAGKYKVVFPMGDYMINGLVSIKIPSNSYLEWGKGAVFKCIPNDKNSYRIINIKGIKDYPIKNVLLVNPTVVGDRNFHRGTKGEHGHGIVISGAKNIKIENPKTKDCWGDGFAIYGAENIEVNNLISDNNRRQGLTITSGKNILFKNPICSNTNGTAPESGIDIEPNYPTDRLENIKILNAKTSNNRGAGIATGCRQFFNGERHVTIDIVNHQDDGSAQGYMIATLGKGTIGKLSGHIKNVNSKYRNNLQNGVLIRAYSSENSPKIILDNIEIINPNCSGQSSPRWGSGISIIREKATRYLVSMGNITIKSTSIEDTRKVPLMRRGIYCFDDNGKPLKNLKIINPKKIKGIQTREMIDFNIDGAVIKDKNKVTAMNIQGNTVLLSRVYSEINNIGASRMTEVTLKIGRQKDSPITFINSTPNGMKIIPLAYANILPLSKKGGKAILSRELGATITLNRESKDTWRVINMTGNWSIEK